MGDFVSVFAVMQAREQLSLVFIPMEMSSMYVPRMQEVRAFVLAIIFFQTGLLPVL
jgi:hypothetical protein